MLFAADQLARIRDGSIDLAFRRWRRPSVKAGTSLRTAIGIVHIVPIAHADEAQISDEDARRAGLPDRAALVTRLARSPSGDLYRIELAYGGPDPRDALRDTLPDDVHAIIAGLERRRRSRAAHHLEAGQLLFLIRDNAGTRAADLAGRAGVDTLRFKNEVRKFKALGLTESLPTGYRLSRRGEAVLAALLRRNDVSVDPT